MSKGGNCVRCSTFVESYRRTCPYCGTVYLPVGIAFEYRVPYNSPDKIPGIIEAASKGRMTPNKARRLLGLEEIHK